MTLLRAVALSVIIDYFFPFPWWVSLLIGSGLALVVQAWRERDQAP